MSVYSVKGKGWRYDFTLDGLRRTAAGFKTKREAQGKEAEEKRRLLAGPEGNDGPTPTDMDFLTLLTLLNNRLEYLEAYKSQRYLTDQRYLAKRWAARWGRLKCGEISTEVIQRFLLQRKKVSAHTSNKELRMLRATFNFGRKKGWLASNPTDGFEFFPVDKRFKYVPPAEDIEKVIAAADPDTRDNLRTIRETMARVSEVNQLTWNDVDLEDRHVVLYTRKKRGGHLTPRKVPMTQRLFEILSRRHGGRDRGKPWVYWHRYRSTKTGETEEGPFQQRKRLMKGLCEKAGVKHFGFHALRHSGASVMDKANVPIGSIQRILGHENRSTTEIYLHSIGEAERQAMEIFERETGNLAPV